MLEFVSLAKLQLFMCRLTLLFFLTENRHCGSVEVEEKVEEGRKVGIAPDDGGCWVVVMDSDAESRVHAHCGALESLGRIDSRGRH